MSHCKAGLAGVAEAALIGLPDEIGDDRIVLVVVPEHAAGGSGHLHHRLAREVTRRLPGLLDAGAVPDLVLTIDDLPCSGRGPQARPQGPGRSSCPP